MTVIRDDLGRPLDDFGRPLPGGYDLADWDHQGARGAHRGGQPQKHGYAYYVYWGCQCEVCQDGCRKEQSLRGLVSATA